MQYLLKVRCLGNAALIALSPSMCRVWRPTVFPTLHYQVSLSLSWIDSQIYYCFLALEWYLTVVSALSLYNLLWALLYSIVTGKEYWHIFTCHFSRTRLKKCVCHIRLNQLKLPIFNHFYLRLNHMKRTPFNLFWPTKTTVSCGST